MAKFKVLLTIGVAAALVLVAAALHAAHMGAATSEAEISIINQTQDELVVKFVDANGQSLTVTFDQVTDDVHTFWKPVSDLQLETGIAFGNGSPNFPSSAMVLTDEEIDETNLINEFSASVADETLDDLTIYQSFHGEIAVALHNDGLVTTIYYAGLWVPFVTIPPPDPLPQLCSRWVAGCCRMMCIEIDPQTGECVPCQEGLPNMPNPYLPACISGYEHCRTVNQNQICNCLWEACNDPCNWNVHFAACDVFFDLCMDPPEPDLKNEEIISLLGHMGDMIALQLSSTAEK